MSGDYNGIERRGPHRIPDHVLDKIAEKAAEKALDKVATSVGYVVLKRSAYFIGAGVIALILVLKGGDLKSLLKLWADSP